MVFPYGVCYAEPIAQDHNVGLQAHRQLLQADSFFLAFQGLQEIKHISFLGQSRTFRGLLLSVWF